MSLDHFVLAPEVARDEAIRPIVEQAVSFVVSEVGPARIDAVILTGSLSRGEGSLLATPSGFRLLGDVEFLVVFKDASGWPTIRRQMADVSRRATSSLGADGALAGIEYGPVGPAYFPRKMQPSIFAFDLLTHGKVLWGRREILDEARTFPVSAIPPEDAIALIMNRMVELLDIEDAEPNPQTRAYHGVKIMLDLAGSVLAFTGRHVSSYAGRPEPFQALVGSLGDLEKSLSDHQRFMERLAWAVRCKYSPSDTLLLDSERDELLGTIAGWARALWMWEVGRLLNCSDATFPDLVERYLAHERMAGRVKGWAKFCLHPLRPRGTLRPLKDARLFLEGSPQALTYAAALLLYEARFGTSDGRCLERAGALLPVPRLRAFGAVSPREVCDLWRWLVRNG